MAITHNDLAPSRKGNDVGSKTGVPIMVFSIILGLVCFILSLIAEATRSEVNWTRVTSDEGKGVESECSYTSSGKLPLTCAAAAFLTLAIAIVVHHTYLLVAVSKSDALVNLAWDSNSAISRSLTWQAGFFFVSTWMSFAMGEILLLIGLSMESGHLSVWATPRPVCLINKRGLFAAGGVFGLLAVFLASGLYITALRMEMHFQGRGNWRREVLGPSATYAAPPADVVMAVHDDGASPPRSNVDTLEYYLRVFDKPWDHI